MPTKNHQIQQKPSSDERSLKKSRKRKLIASSDDAINTRDLENLYASTSTLNCAQHHCVPCAYKIGCFDVALDTEFAKLVPNQRPEQCPRSSSVQNCSDGILGYRQGMMALTVGDGDMSFSLALARLLKPRETTSTVIGTSYEDKETLLKTYPDFENNSKELQKLGAKLLYNVDATKLKEYPELCQTKFHRICWNFPCTAISNGQDGQNDAMEENKNLVRTFMKGAKKMLFAGGEIHMAHKTKPPYNQWKLEKVALESMQEKNRLNYLGRVVLDRYLLPPYTPRKALDKKSFPCHDACFYIFGKRKEGEFPSTINGSISITVETIVSLRRSLMARAAESKKSNKNKQRKEKWHG